MPQSPMYRNIADDLRAKIEDGTLGPNEKLPSEGELSKQYDASRNTVREAIRRLTDEGLLESRPGQGTFVARKVNPFVTVLTADPKTGFGGGDTAAYLTSGFRLALMQAVYTNEESAFDLGGLGLSRVLSTSEPKALSR